MKKYSVDVCLPLWARVIVEAENEDDAYSKALEKADTMPLDNFTIGESYVPDGSCESTIREVK